MLRRRNPTQLTLQRLRGREFVVDVTERRIPGACIFKDVFGFANLLTVSATETLLVQITSETIFAAVSEDMRHRRRRPMAGESAAQNLRAWLGMPRIGRRTGGLATGGASEKTSPCLVPAPCSSAIAVSTPGYVAAS